MAKKKTKKAKSAARAKWNGTRVWVFENAEDDVIVKDPPNQFTLVPVGFEDAPHPLVYQVKSDATHPVTALWKDVKLAWIDGKPLKMRFGHFEGSETAERKERLRRYKKTILKLKKPEDRATFERLVGLGKMPDGSDAVLTFFLAEKEFTDGAKGIIVAMVDQDVAGPSGAGVGNG